MHKLCADTLVDGQSPEGLCDVSHYDAKSVTSNSTIICLADSPVVQHACNLTKKQLDAGSVIRSLEQTSKCSWIRHREFSRHITEFRASSRSRTLIEEVMTSEIPSLGLRNVYKNLRSNLDPKKTVLWRKLRVYFGEVP